MVDISLLDTEQENVFSSEFSELSIKQAIRLMNMEDYNAVSCIRSEFDIIEKVISDCNLSLNSGGRIIYIGAGTSGRLGLIDAVECPPTFGVDYNTVVGLIAGGDNAFIKAQEKVEDKKESAIVDLKKINFCSKDILIGIAASGRTPYVIGALEYAEKIGSKYAAIVCTHNSEISKICKNIIEIVPGAEVLTGSTRLKAGTATKLVLNMISTISMRSIGKIYKNYMVDVKQSNEKLEKRAINIVKSVTNCTEKVATDALKKSSSSVKEAIVMILLDCSVEEAQKKLKQTDGHISKLID